MPVTVSGRFNGTGAAVYVCIGFVPDALEIWSPTSTTGARLKWNRKFGTVNAVEGFRMYNSAAVADLAYGEGVAGYLGGDLMTSTIQPSVGNGGGVYVRPDYTDYRISTNGEIKTWTLGSSANRTGNWDVACNTTYVGVGSRINIDGKWYKVLAMTSTGVTANYVTLDVAAPSGSIYAIRNKFESLPLPLGTIAPAGFKVSSTSIINVNDEIQVYEATLFDN